MAQMRYPYTLGAQLMRFPYKHHFKDHWIGKSFVIGWLVSIPVFYKIHRLSNSVPPKEKKAH